MPLKQSRITFGINQGVLTLTDKPETIQAFLCLLETLGRSILSA